MTVQELAPATLDPRTLIAPELFERLTSRLAREKEISQADAANRVTQALAFLKASADNPGKHLAPPFPVDDAWHLFILHTKEYAAFCHRIAGRFIHHVPADGMPDDGEAIQATADLMRRSGLPVDDQMWAPQGTGCNNACHADCNAS